MPHILEEINEFLDFKSLIKSKEVSRMMCSIIAHQKSGKILPEKVIQRYIKNPKEFGKDWKIVFQKLSFEKLKELTILVKYFYKAVPSRLNTLYATDSTLVCPVKMEYGPENNNFVLKMTMKSSLENFF